MRRRRRVVNILVRLACTVLTAAVMAWPMGSHAQASATANLHRVKSVFLERVLASPQVGERLIAAVTDALVSHGFVVVEKRPEADATVRVDISQWVTLDGPQPDPPRFTFRGELVSTALQVQWRTEFDINSRADEREVSRMAMQRLVENLFNAWSKSASEAGIRVVGRRVP
jgi:hypothetical protein